MAYKDVFEAEWNLFHGLHFNKFTIKSHFGNAVCILHFKQGKNKCTFKKNGFTNITVHDLSCNHECFVPSYYCQERPSETLNLITNRFDFHFTSTDFINLSIDCVKLGQIYVTFQLILFCNNACLDKPRNTPAQWSNLIFNLHKNQIQSLAISNHISFDMDNLNTYVKNSIPSMHHFYLIYHYLYVCNWLPYEQQMNHICYRMGTTSLIFGWTFDVAKQIWDTSKRMRANFLVSENDNTMKNNTNNTNNAHNPNDTKENNNFNNQNDTNDTNDTACNDKSKDNNQWQKSRFRIKAACLVLINDVELITHIRLTPNCSEGHEFSIPECADFVMNFLKFSETIIPKKEFKCDGLSANIFLAAKTRQYIIDNFGSKIGNYDLTNDYFEMLVSYFYTATHMHCYVKCVCGI